MKIAALAAMSVIASSAAVMAKDAPIRYLNELSDAEAQHFTDAATTAAASAQAAVKANPAAFAELKARGVALSNVIGTQKALDGATVFIVR